ncbi:Zn-ribbon domain-containing OB-fold protein [Novosphingobium malaysiense]|uniref:DNA-binding protein n=1 Tax=Novosphingobium malaysiense TaxID=1348853 RepID=A0A0B1ZFL2_9SPHN|nr:OB-fold domain-containing protein [Novosphingobium malaysiense]KHK89876.1 DNA-binding protein [Novosphingobium malaysiense]
MRAIAENLFTNETPPRLIGGRDRETGRIVFPCPEGGQYEAVPLASEGTLWSFTVQRFRPKSPPYAGPEAFAPWIVAYVELPGQVIVEARLVDVAFEDVTIGMPVRFTQAPLDPEAPDSVMIPAFAPIGDKA